MNDQDVCDQLAYAQVLALTSTGKARTDLAEILGSVEMQPDYDVVVGLAEKALKANRAASELTVDNSCFDNDELSSLGFSGRTAPPAFDWGPELDRSKRAVATAKKMRDGRIGK